MSGSGKLRTATFFVKDLGSGEGYDIIVEGDPEAVVSFVRVVKVPAK